MGLDGVPRGAVAGADLDPAGVWGSVNLNESRLNQSESMSTNYYATTRDDGSAAHKQPRCDPPGRLIPAEHRLLDEGAVRMRSKSDL